ncbi:MAG: phage tail protein I [Terriglobales bacterium]
MFFMAASDALTPIMQAFVQQITSTIIFGNLGGQPEAIIDFLAIYHFNVDYYDTTLPLSTKVGLVQNVILNKIIKGTPQAILNIINGVFQYCELIEWFNDSPVAEANTFRVQVTQSVINPAQVAAMTRAILTFKNARSYFAGVSSIETALFPALNAGVQTGEFSYQLLTFPTG